jgi:hypothetical protein
MDVWLAVFLASYALLIGMPRLAQRELERFIAATPVIDGTASLERFKAIARHNMYGALVLIVAGVLGIVAGLGVLSRHGLAGGALVTVANVLLFAAVQRMQALERLARGLPCSSPELEREHRRIGEVWQKKPLPDF